MILDKILDYKKEELTHFKHQVPLQEIKARVRDAREPLKLDEVILNTTKPFAVIAEVKRKSPSKGVIRKDFDPVATARDYEEHGAAAISVLTDEHFFGGHLNYLREIRQAVRLPLLRKDFVWDPYQIYVALEAGADAILLIAAMLEKSQAADLQGLAQDLGLSVLFEVHDEEECAMAQDIQAQMIGVNNRNLNSFQVDVQTSIKLFPLLSHAKVKISESGLDSAEALTRLKNAGADGFLIGESLMRQKSPGKALEELLA